jgi:hypothetical protein
MKVRGEQNSNYAAFALFIFCTLFSSAGFAQETPILVAKQVQVLHRWCGDYLVYGTEGTLTFWDGLSGKQFSLHNQPVGRILDCSPNARWMLTANGGWSPHEGGDPTCDPPAKIALPKLVLWDVSSSTHTIVGQGFANFAWSPDGKALLYRFDPICDLERDRRNSFRVPVGITEFHTVSAQTLIERAFGRNGDPPNRGRIGDFVWYANDKFVTQLPAGEGDLLTFTPPAGAVVAVHYDQGRLTGIEQLNPAGFDSSWKLPIAQLTSEASEQILKAADCAINDYALGTRDSSLGCRSAYEVDRTRTAFHFDPTKYCNDLGTADAKEFCSPVPPTMHWQQITHGPVTLVLKPISFDQKPIPGFDLYRIGLR